MPLQKLPAQLGQGLNEILLRRGRVDLDGTCCFCQIFFQQGHEGILGNIHAEGRGNFTLIHGDHIRKIQLRAGRFVKALAGEYVDIRVGQLAFDDLTARRRVDHMARQRRQIGDAFGQCRGADALLGADDANNAQVLAGSDSRFHIRFIAGHIFPDLVFTVVAVQSRNRDQLEFQLQQILIGPFLGTLRVLIFLAAHDFRDDFLQNRRILQAHGIGHIVRDLVGIGQDHDHLSVMLRPAAFDHIILRIQQFPVIDHFIEHIRCHVG